jgi:hypothetical protein
MRKTTQPTLEIAKLVSRFRRIMTAAQKAKVRVLLCGDIPDPRPAVDSKLKLLDEALEDLEMGEGNRFLALRSSLLDAQGHVRTDIFKPRGDIHLNAAGNQIVSLRIQQMLRIMLPNLAPAQVPGPAPAPVQAPPAPVPEVVQAPVVAKRQRVRVLAPVQDEAPAPVVVNTTPIVNATLVAAPVVNAPVVAQAPAGVQQLVGQVQDLVLQHVAVQNVVPETPMEVEDEDSILERLFFKKYGRALPEKEKESDVDKINFVIDLTDEDEMEVATSDNVPAVAVVKTEPIEIAANVNVNNVNNKYDVYNESGIRVSRRLELIELAKARKAITEFGKSLRKKDIILEKEAPLAASSNVIATEDTDMAEDVSVNEANSDNPVGSVNSVTIEEAERAIAESEAAIAATQKVIDEFDD